MSERTELTAALAAYDEGAMRSGGETYFRASEARRIIARAERIGARVLGIEAIRWDGQSIVPMEDFIADFSARSSPDDDAGSARVIEHYFRELPVGDDVFVSLHFAHTPNP